VIRRLGPTFLVGLLSLLLAGCGDDPFAIIWTANPQTASIFSVSREELNLGTGFSFNERRPLRIEAPGASGRWELAVDFQGGNPVLLPPGAFGIPGEARLLALPGETFDGVREAPEDLELYSRDQPLPAVPGQLYVVRTNQQLSAFGSRCVFYGKFLVEEVDAVQERLTFRFDTNIACNSRNLRPDRQPGS